MTPSPPSDRPPAPSSGTTLGLSRGFIAISAVHGPGTIDVHGESLTPSAAIDRLGLGVAAAAAGWVRTGDTWALPGAQEVAEERLRAERAEERGQGICRTCLAPIWNEGGTVGRRHRGEGWSDRIEQGGDSLVCFKAVGYRHVPLTGREASIYDHAFARGAESGEAGHRNPVGGPHCREVSR